VLRFENLENGFREPMLLPNADGWLLPPESSYSCSVISVPALPVCNDAQNECVRGMVAVIIDVWVTILN